MKLLALLLFSSVAVAQQSATTSAPCSPIAPDNSGSITINCPGMSKEDGRKMIAILNRILANQIDPDLVMVKLDEIQRGVSSIENELAEKKKEEEEAEKKRRTAPLIVPMLVPVSPGKVNLCVHSNNLIPYQYRYFIVGSTNTIIGGFPVQMDTVYPTSAVPDFCITKDIDLRSISGHYIELSFTFMSLSYEELHLPGHFGQFVIGYDISDDGTVLRSRNPKCGPTGRSCN
jgi:hypothetical protein